LLRSFGDDSATDESNQNAEHQICKKSTNKVQVSDSYMMF